MEALIVLLSLAVLAVPVLLVVALAMIGDLRRRVRGLEQRYASLSAREPPPRAQAARAPEGVPARRQPQPAAASAPPSQDRERAPAAAESPEPFVSAPAAAAPVVVSPQPASPQRLESPAQGDGGDGAIARLLRWFATGNVIAKVGMLVLLAGVAALLKYASDQGWLSVPVGWRLAGIAAAALAALAFGWRQRGDRRVFALTLQGGAIGVLLLTVFAAFRLYELIPVVPAFALSVALVAALCVLAVLQDARTLAIFGILAGFLAPIWLSTGVGNHVVLFSYYALLNLGVLAAAWLRPWRELNLLGFAFTWGIGVIWGVLRYDPAGYATVQPFLLLFFAFYLVIPLLYLRRRPGHGYDHVDGALVFGTPLVAFPLQALLLDGERLPMALCALALAGLYAVLAWQLIGRDRYRGIGVAMTMLAVGFATLAIPLAFSARVTACLFALEGAALIWLGLRQRRWLPQAAGVALQLIAALAHAFAVAWKEAEQAWMFANPAWLSALLIAVAGFASAWTYWQGERPVRALAAYGWGLAWWLLAGMAEIGRHVPPEWALHAQLALIAVTAWIAAEAWRTLRAPALAPTVAGMFVLALATVLGMSAGQAHPLAAGGWWAWTAFVPLGARSLWCLRGSGGAAAPLAQALWWLAWPLALSLSAAHLGGQASLAQGWQWAAVALPWLLFGAASVWGWRWLRLPLGVDSDRARPAFQLSLFAVLGLCWLAGLGLAGDAAPLPWLPLLNPLEALQALGLALLAWWMHGSGQAPAPLAARVGPVAGALLFVLSSAVVLRAIHHWTGVDWSAALWNDNVAQTGLTVLWSVLGMAAWIAGSRRGARGLWLAGAVLMGVVLAKLVLVDRQYLGNLPGILSFIAYGGLCMAVGYFAPAPPRRQTLASDGKA